MKNIRNILLVIFAVFIVVGGVAISTSDLTASVIKPKKSTTLKFCPETPELVYQTNTTAGQQYGRNQRNVKYETFAQFADALKSELNANNGSTRCTYRIVAYPDKDNARSSQTFRCSGTALSVSEGEVVSCGFNDTKTSAQIFIYGENYIEAQSGVFGHMEFGLTSGKFTNTNNGIQAYFVERS